MSDHDLPLEGEHEPLDPVLEAELAEALRAAFAPAPLDERRHRELVARALEDPLAPPTDDELRESERLRKALDDGDASHPDAALARALAAAARPSEPTEVVKKRAQTALSSGAARPNVIYVTFGALSLAAAAAFVLFVATGQRSEPAATAQSTGPKVVYSRSTSELFDARFELSQTTARMDRIAEARERDLRSNRYTRWGAR